MAQYKTGSVTVSDSATVEGSGTTWTGGNVNPGDIFTVIGDNAWYEVASVTDADTLVLTSAYAGTPASGVSYTISRDFTTRNGYPYPQKGDIETAALIKRALEQIDADTSKMNMAATTDPTVTDDSDSNYSVGSRWINVSTDELWECMDSTVGAAVWFLLSGELYHQGSKKLEATADGVTITGDLTITGEIDGGTF